MLCSLWFGEVEPLAEAVCCVTEVQGVEVNGHLSCTLPGQQLPNPHQAHLHSVVYAQESKLGFPCRQYRPVQVSFLRTGRSSAHASAKVAAAMIK